MCELTVLVNLCLVLFAVCQATCSPDATADTSHTFNEVIRQEIFRCTHKRTLTFFDTVAGQTVKLEVLVTLFLESFRNCVCKTAATCKYSSLIGSVVKLCSLKLGYLYILAVEDSL